MANIKPTQNFVLVQFVSKDGNPNPIILPDGAKDPDSKIIVLAVGPDVPRTTAENPEIIPLTKGTHVILRGDSKHFEAGPGSEQLQIALVDHRSIIAIVEPTPGDFSEVVDKAVDEVPEPTDAELDKIIEDTRIG